MSIKKCTCTHTFQDKKYGRKLRVHNKAVKKGSSDVYRCTVCGNEKRVV